VNPNLLNFCVELPKAAVSVCYSTDRHGLRNPDRDYRASRIFLVGDSFTFGAWVPREKTFFGLIEKELGEPVISLGVGGYGIEQYEIMVKRFVAQYHPQTVLICMFANDLRAPRTHDNMTYYYERNGWYKYRNENASSYPLQRKTLTYQLLSLAKRLVSGDVDCGRRARSGLMLYKYRGASKNYFSKGYNIDLEKGYSRIIDYARDQGSAVSVVLIPSKESVHKDDYIRLFDENYLCNEEEGYARLRKIANSLRIPCLDLTEELRSRSKDTRTYLESDPHWNELGHKIAAQEIMKHLIRPGAL
jgi:hypothetical protein